MVYRRRRWTFKSLLCEAAGSPQDLSRGTPAHGQDLHGRQASVVTYQFNVCSTVCTLPSTSLSLVSSSARSFRKCSLATHLNLAPRPPLGSLLCFLVKTSSS